MLPMFHADTAFALELIALVLAVALLVWAKYHSNQSVTLAKATGYLVMVLAILGLACTSYYTVTYWFAGYFDIPQMTQQCQIENQTTQK